MMQVCSVRDNDVLDLEDDRTRCYRNDGILRSVENIRSRVTTITSKTERLRLLTQYYGSFLRTNMPYTKKNTYKGLPIEVQNIYGNALSSNLVGNTFRRLSFNYFNPTVYFPETESKTICSNKLIAKTDHFDTKNVDDSDRYTSLLQRNTTNKMPSPDFYLDDRKFKFISNEYDPTFKEQFTLNLNDNITKRYVELSPTIDQLNNKYLNDVNGLQDMNKTQWQRTTTNIEPRPSNVLSVNKDQEESFQCRECQYRTRQTKSVLYNVKPHFSLNKKKLNTIVSGGIKKSQLHAVDDIFKRYLINYDQRYLRNSFSEPKRYVQPLRKNDQRYFDKTQLFMDRHSRDPPNYNYLQATGRFNKPEAYSKYGRFKDDYEHLNDYSHYTTKNSSNKIDLYLNHSPYIISKGNIHNEGNTCSKPSFKYGNYNKRIKESLNTYTLLEDDKSDCYGISTIPSNLLTSHGLKDYETGRTPYHYLNNEPSNVINTRPYSTNKEYDVDTFRSEYNSCNNQHDHLISDHSRYDDYPSSPLRNERKLYNGTSIYEQGTANEGKLPEKSYGDSYLSHISSSKKPNRKGMPVISEYSENNTLGGQSEKYYSSTRHPDMTFSNNTLSSVSGDTNKKSDIDIILTMHGENEIPLILDDPTLNKTEERRDVINSNLSSVITPTDEYTSPDVEKMYKDKNVPTSGLNILPRENNNVIDNENLIKGTDQSIIQSIEDLNINNDIQNTLNDDGNSKSIIHTSDELLEDYNGDGVHLESNQLHPHIDSNKYKEYDENPNSSDVGSPKYTDNISNELLGNYNDGVIGESAHIESNSLNEKHLDSIKYNEYDDNRNSTDEGKSKSTEHTSDHFHGNNDVIGEKVSLETNALHENIIDMKYNEYDDNPNTTDESNSTVRISNEFTDNNYSNDDLHMDSSQLGGQVADIKYNEYEEQEKHEIDYNGISFTPENPNLVYNSDGITDMVSGLVENDNNSNQETYDTIDNGHKIEHLNDYQDKEYVQKGTIESDSNFERAPISSNMQEFPAGVKYEDLQPQDYGPNYNTHLQDQSQYDPTRPSEMLEYNQDQYNQPAVSDYEEHNNDYQPENYSQEIINPNTLQEDSQIYDDGYVNREYQQPVQYGSDTFNTQDLNEYPPQQYSNENQYQDQYSMNNDGQYLESPYQEPQGDYTANQYDQSYPANYQDGGQYQVGSAEQYDVNPDMSNPTDVTNQYDQTDVLYNNSNMGDQYQEQVQQDQYEGYQHDTNQYGNDTINENYEYQTEQREIETSHVDPRAYNVDSSAYDAQDAYGNTIGDISSNTNTRLKMEEQNYVDNTNTQDNPGYLEENVSLSMTRDAPPQLNYDEEVIGSELNNQQTKVDDQSYVENVGQGT